MKNVKVPATGCAHCRATLALLEALARERGVDIEREKVEVMPAIIGYGVMATPGGGGATGGGARRRRAGPDQGRGLVLASVPHRRLWAVSVPTA